MWNPNRGRCSFLSEVRGSSRCGSAGSSAGYAQPPMPMYLPRVQRNLQTLGILWCVFGVYRVISGLIGMFFLRAFTTHNFGDDAGCSADASMGLFAPMWMGALWPLIAFATVLCRCAGAHRRIWPAESQAVGQDRGDHRGDPCDDQISLWYGAGYLYAVGAGARSFWAGVRRDCGPKLRASRKLLT